MSSWLCSNLLLTDCVMRHTCDHIEFMRDSICDWAFSSIFDSISWVLVSICFNLLLKFLLVDYSVLPVLLLFGDHYFFRDGSCRKSCGLLTKINCFGFLHSFLFGVTGIASHSLESLCSVMLYASIVYFLIRIWVRLGYGNPGRWCSAGISAW